MAEAIAPRPCTAASRRNSATLVMKKFRANTADLLIATDVAARGLDVEHVSHVVVGAIVNEAGVDPRANRRDPDHGSILIGGDSGGYRGQHHRNPSRHNYQGEARAGAARPRTGLEELRRRGAGPPGAPVPSSGVEWPLDSREERGTTDSE